MHRAEPVISVVIPAYNAERTLAKTVRSALLQSLREIEVIIVDDASTDGTARLAMELAATDGRVRVLASTINSGVANARNLGIAAAKGHYIAPLDADDLWHPEKAARQLAAIKADPMVGLVYCFTDRIDATDKILARMTGVVAQGPALLQHAAYNFCGNGSSILFPRALCLRLGGYSPTLRRVGAEGCEDYLMQLRILHHHRVACVPDYLVGYRMHSETMSMDYLTMALSRSIVLRLAMSALGGNLRWAANAALLEADFGLLRLALLKHDFSLARSVRQDLVWREGWARMLAQDLRRAPRFMAQKAATYLARRAEAESAAMATFGDDEKAPDPWPLRPRMRSLLSSLAAADLTLEPHNEPLTSRESAVESDALIRHVHMTSGESLAGWDSDAVSTLVKWLPA